MLRAALLLSLALCAVTPAQAQEGAPKAPYTIDEYVQARRPVVAKRPLTNDEKMQARKLIDEINTTLKRKQRPAHILMEQLAPLAETGDKPAMKAMMMGYAEADGVKPWPADATGITAWTPNMMLAGLWATKVWEAGDRSKDTSKAIDNCWRKNTALMEMCGFTIKVDEDFRNPFNDHWAHNQGAPKNAVFTERTLTPSPEKQKERFDKMLAVIEAGAGEYASWELLWAEVWANRAGGDYPKLLETARRVGFERYKSRKEASEADDKAARERAIKSQELAIAEAKVRREEKIKSWETLQADRVSAKSFGRTPSEKDETEWVRLSHELGGRYLAQFASENVLMTSTAIDALCDGGPSALCEKQRTLYRYRAEAAMGDRSAQQRSLSFGSGGGDVSVRTYDSQGNYLGTITMPSWQADIIR